MSYYKRFNKSEHTGFAPSERVYEQYKQLDGAIVSSDAKGEFVLVRTELIDEFIITALSRQDFRSEGFIADNVSDDDMQDMADAMAEQYIEYGGYWEEIDGYGESLGLETCEAENKDEDEEDDDEA